MYSAEDTLKTTPFGLTCKATGNFWAQNSHQDCDNAEILV